MSDRSFAYCLALALLCAGGPALAADGPKSNAPTAPGTTDRADQVFRQGLAAYDSGRLEEAERLFQQAWELKQTHDIAGNLGVVELLRGKPRDAAEHIAWALRHMPPTESSKMRKGLEGELQKARQQVGAIRVRVDVDGADVIVNGRDAGKSPLTDEVFVAPGLVKIEVRHEGYIAGQQSVQLGKGEARDVALTLVPVEAPKRSIIPGVVLGSVAGVALVTGIGLFAGGRSKGSSASNVHDAILNAGHSCVAGAGNYDARCSDLQSTTSTANTLQRAGVGLFVGAGAAAAAAAIYFLVPPSSSGKTSSGGVRITPAVSPTTAGLVFSAAF